MQAKNCLFLTEMHTYSVLLLATAAGINTYTLETKSIYNLLLYCPDKDKQHMNLFQNAKKCLNAPLLGIFTKNCGSYKDMLLLEFL